MSQESIIVKLSNNTEALLDDEVLDYPVLYMLINRTQPVKLPVLLQNKNPRTKPPIEFDIYQKTHVSYQKARLTLGDNLTIVTSISQTDLRLSDVIFVYRIK